MRLLAVTGEETCLCGNPPCKKLGLEVEFSRYEGALHEAVEIHG